MKWETTRGFDADFNRLSENEQQLFRKAVRDAFAPAADRRAANPSAAWPRRLRVKGVRGCARDLGDDVVVLRPGWAGDLRMDEDRRGTGDPLAPGGWP